MYDIYELDGKEKMTVCVGTDENGKKTYKEFVVFPDLDAVEAVPLIRQDFHAGAGEIKKLQLNPDLVEDVRQLAYNFYEVTTWEPVIEDGHELEQQKWPALWAAVKREYSNAYLQAEGRSSSNYVGEIKEFQTAEEYYCSQVDFDDEDNPFNKAILIEICDEDGNVLSSYRPQK